MQFAFRPLALQIYQSISPAQLLLASKTIDTDKQTAIRLANNLQLDFMEQYFKAARKKEQTACIRATQSCLVNLADKLQSYITQINQLPVPVALSEECISFYKNIEAPLLHLLGFLQTNFEEHFNNDQKMPEADSLQTQQYFLLSAANLEKQVAKSISMQMLQLITTPIKAYYNPGSDCRLSYGMYRYWKTVLEQLQLVSTSGNDAWIQTLILHNFNHGGFINYVMETYQLAMVHDTAAQKIEQWAIHLRAVNRLHPIPNLSLYKDAPTCQQLLLTAINAEITINQTQFSNAQSPNPQSPKPFQTTLSVPQLAAMVRLLVDAGILTCDNQTLLLKNISRNFTTRQQQEVSHESLRQKYYNPDTATVSILKTHLANMMGQLRLY